MDISDLHRAPSLPLSSTLLVTCVKILQRRSNISLLALLALACDMWKWLSNAKLGEPNRCQLQCTKLACLPACLGSLLVLPSVWQGWLHDLSPCSQAWAFSLADLQEASVLSVSELIFLCIKFPWESPVPWSSHQPHAALAELFKK